MFKILLTLSVATFIGMGLWTTHSIYKLHDNPERIAAYNAIHKDADGNRILPYRDANGYRRTGGTRIFEYFGVTK